MFYNNLYVVLVSKYYDMVFSESEIIDYLYEVNDMLLNLIYDSSDEDIIEFFEFYNDSVADVFDDIELFNFFNNIDEVYEFAFYKNRFDLYKYIVDTHNKNIKFEDENYVIDEYVERFNGMYLSPFYFEDFNKYLNTFFKNLESVDRYRRYIDYIMRMNIKFSTSAMLNIYPRVRIVLYNCDMYNYMTTTFKFMDITNEEMKKSGIMCLQDIKGDNYMFKIDGMVYKTITNCVESSTVMHRYNYNIVNARNANEFLNEFMNKYLDVPYILSSNALLFSDLPKELTQNYYIHNKMQVVSFINFINEFLEYSTIHRSSNVFKFKYNNIVIHFIKSKLKVLLMLV
jgi:hypothetical protein